MEAKPFYNYLKTLENITRDLTHTRTSVDQSQETQQVKNNRMITMKKQEKGNRMSETQIEARNHQQTMRESQKEIWK